MNSPTKTQSDFARGDWSAGITATAGSRIAAVTCASAAWGWVGRTCAVCLLIIDHHAWDHSSRSERLADRASTFEADANSVNGWPACGRFGPCMSLQLTPIIAVSPPAIVTVTQ